MAIQTTDLVKFLYGVNGTPSTKAGEISFDSGKQAIYVGDGSAAQLVTSSVKDATFVENVLTITKVTGDTVTLDFSDVASADQTSKILGTLRTDINTNATAITNLGTAVDTSIKALDASYKAADASIRADFAAADTSLSERIAAFESGDNSVATQIANAIGALDSSKEVEDASKFVKVKVDIVDGKLSENGVVVSTNDIASAAALAEVKTTADAAATASDLTDHTGNGDIHVTAQQKTDWQNATDAINAFLATEGDTTAAIDTLKEIQDFLTSDDGTVETLLGKVDDIEKSLANGGATANAIAAAQDAADQAQDEVDALETEVSTLSSNFTDHSTNGDIHVTTADKAKWNAAEQNAKDYAKTYADDLASNYDKAGDASKAETAAKTYADAIKVNGQEQASQEITLTGVNIKVGGTSDASASTIEDAVADLYGKVAAAEAAGVQSIAVNTEDVNYAAVDKTSGAVTFSIKTQDVSTAEAGKTGLVDALEAKNYVSFRIAGAKSDIIGTAADASNADTVYGAKKYAEELNTAMDARMDVVEAQLKWGLLA